MRNLLLQALLTCVSVLLAAPKVWAQQPAVIYSSAKSVSVRITQPTSLYSTLQTLCEHSQAICEISAANNDALVLAPMNLQGSWEQVVRKLLEGTELNFTMLPPGRSGVPGKLIVAARSGRVGPSFRVAEPPRNDMEGRQAANYIPPVESVSQSANEPSPKTEDEPSPADSPSQSGIASTSGPAFSSQSGSSSDALAKLLSGEAATTKEIGIPLPGMSSQKSVATGLPLPAAPREAPTVSGGPLPVAH